MAIIFAPVQPIVIVRGTKWEDDVQLVDSGTQTPVSLVGITELWMRVREYYDGPSLLELTTANGRLVLVDVVEGKIGIRVSSAGTLLLPDNSNERAAYLYDIVIERVPDEYEAAASGRLDVLPQITRPWATT